MIVVNYGSGQYYYDTQYGQEMRNPSYVNNDVAHAVLVFICIFGCCIICIGSGRRVESDKYSLQDIEETTVVTTTVENGPPVGQYPPNAYAPAPAPAPGNYGQPMAAGYGAQP